MGDILRRRSAMPSGNGGDNTLLYHLASPITNNSKKLLGIAPFSEGKAVTILFELSVPAGGAIPNGVRLYGLDGAIWSIGVGSAYFKSTADGSTSAGLWYIARVYGAKLGSTSVLVKDTIYRIGMTYDPGNLLVTVYWKGGGYDSTYTIQQTGSLVYSNELGFNVGTSTRNMTVRKFDVYQRVLSSEEISTFMNGE